MLQQRGVVPGFQRIQGLQGAARRGDQDEVRRQAEILHRLPHVGGGAAAALVQRPVAVG